MLTRITDNLYVNVDEVEAVEESNAYNHALRVDMRSGSYHYVRYGDGPDKAERRATYLTLLGAPEETG